MRIGMEIFKGEVAAVTDLVEGFHDRRPVRRAIQKGAERFQGKIGPLFRELLEMNVLDPPPQKRDPVLGKLKEHDVPRVEVYAHVVAVEAVDKGIHFGGGHQVAVEENV